ncbi:lipase family alpha/beta hydrolase [Massilia orientalis]|jgi:triacylglycerol esterase/lipase EstA (alpha/beta hydrolase family)|uniref:Lipase family alpha/beta hydrolase n=1 Tax=Massilia orientalis TaxID=3050128 RepID=A0ACC7MBD0_9BURK|nr:alpha/beta fold hydrolase [Massilia sp. YIM B02787]
MPASARTLLRLVLLVQLAAALLVAWALLHRGVPAWGALLAGAGAVVVVRLAINMNNFVMAARAASHTPPEYRLGPAARLRMLAEEFRASMLVTSWHVPRGCARMSLHLDSGRVPVLLVHGYGCNSGFWAHLEPLLDRERISHATIDLEPVAGSIDDYAPLIEARAQALCAATGAAQIAIVAHSMGGLAARAWMRSYGSARVARLITLGTPHHGTVLANFGLGENAAQMRRDSAWLHDLAAGETQDVRARIVSIYTYHDNIVAPQDSSILPGARTIAFGGVGHVALGSNPRVLAEVLRVLREVQPAMA